jgi:hypothetical protein
VDGALVGAGSQPGHCVVLCCLLGITPVSSGLWMIFLGLGFQPSPALCCCVRCSSFNPGGDFQIQIIFGVYKQKGGKKI